MTYLLDVSALVALGNLEHEFYPRVLAWIQHEDPELMLTCSITELGFVRVLSHPAHGFSVEEAKEILLALKRSSHPPIRFVVDTLQASSLPVWVKSFKQTTDGHLLELARANGARLATLDEGIPGSHVIPRIP